jgi:hypothetical protein
MKHEERKKTKWKKLNEGNKTKEVKKIKQTNKQTNILTFRQITTQTYRHTQLKLKTLKTDLQANKSRNIQTDNVSS